MTLRAFQHLVTAMITLCLVALISPVKVVYAEGRTYPTHLSFQNLLATQKIEPGEIFSILHGSEGFIWLGGKSAVLRFDGYDFVEIPLVITDDNGNSNFVQINQVFEIFEDRENNIWVGSENGLLKLNRGLNELAPFVATNQDTPDLFGKAAVNTIYQEPNGKLLVGTYAGLYIVDAAASTAYEIPVKPEDPNGLQHPLIHDISGLVDGTVWIGSEAGLSKLILAPSMDLNQQENINALSLENLTVYPSDAGSLPKNAVKTIAIDHSGSVWVGTDKGLNRFDASSKTFIHYAEDGDDSLRIYNDHIWDLFVDSKGLLWIATEGGLLLYNDKNNSFQRFQHRDGQEDSLATNVLRRIYEDRNGDLWVGTYPFGINYHNRASRSFTSFKKTPNDPLSLTHSLVSFVAEDELGNLWIGADQGINYFDRKNNAVKHYTQTGGSDSKLQTGGAISGYRDPHGGIWLGTWGGGYQKLNTETDKFEQGPFDASLASRGEPSYTKLNDDVVWSIYQDKDEDIWIGTHRGGLSRFDAKKGEYINYYPDPDDGTSLSHQLVWTMFQDSQGRFWVGTVYGLNLFDPTTNSFKRYFKVEGEANSLRHNSIVVIYEDRESRLWMGTDGGLHMYQPETDDFVYYGKEDGFADIGIRSIVQDKQGHLWMGTNNGITRFHPDTKKITNYQSFNGKKIGGLSKGVATLSRYGEVILGSNNGMWIIDVNNLGANKNPPPVVFTDFKLFAKSVSPKEEGSLLTSVINQTPSITLDYTKSMFSFDFSGLSFRDTEKNEYAYKLEGFDKDWHYVGTQRSAQYTNLNAGHYTLRVKAKNSDGIWNEQGKSIDIIKTPPPWKTWWAYTIYVLTFAGIILAFFMRQAQKRKMVEKQNRHLEEQVALRTADIQQKSLQIRSMLSNMQQGLFVMTKDTVVGNEYSKFLESIFEQSDLSGKNATDLLFSDANIGSNALNQLQESLKAILGEDESNFMFNSHLLITEYSKTINNQEKHLALEWSPIIEANDEVEQLMISVRDITLLKAMEGEAASRKRELDIISRLLNIPARKFIAFLDSTDKFITDNKALVSDGKEDTQSLSLLFRNMHTIKGNCRTFDFPDLSDIAHEIESEYTHLNKNQELKWDHAKMLEGLNTLEQALEEYKNIYYNVLGRGEDKDRSSGLWLTQEKIQALQAELTSALECDSLDDSQATLHKIRQSLDCESSLSFHDAIADIEKSLPEIALHLKKELPKLVIHDNGIRVETASEELLGNVFTHIIRNSMDHGIELPEERTLKDKPAQGTITISLKQCNQQVEIAVADDGQGLNIDRLFSKGVELELWQPGDNIKYSDISHLIFRSGTSTKEEISDISGRGVGMDAVRGFLQDNGGEINIISEADDKIFKAGNEDQYLPFTFVILLPLSLFVPATT